jgi:hypothetical protein
VFVKYTKTSPEPSTKSVSPQEVAP